MMNLIDVPIFESSDEDDDILRLRKPKTFKTRKDYFEELEEEDFYIRFRLRKQTSRNLLEKIREQISSKTNRNFALSAETKLLLSLRHYATGSMLTIVGDFVGVSKAAACKAVREVSKAIAELSQVYIKMPCSDVEIKNMQELFYNIAKFPHVIGAIDCTHIKIQSPGGSTPEIYRNQKGFFSCNVQVIADPQLKIQNIVACWPGSIEDNYIFNNSAIKPSFELGEMGNGILLGDSEYTNTNYLLTPLQNPANNFESLYNESHILTRNVVNKCFKVWKRRFPILSEGMRVSLEKSKVIIMATAILHNIAIEENNGDPPGDNENIVDDINLNTAEEKKDNNFLRNEFIAKHFKN